MPLTARSLFRPALVALLAFSLGTGVTFAASDELETVLVTYQVKADEEVALEQVIAEHWQVALRMKLVLPAPHVVVVGGDHGRRYIIEILTWRDGSIPDSAPDAITRLWERMNERVEPRDGHPGIDLAHVSLVSKRAQP
jgi:hypothetical protein